MWIYGSGFPKSQNIGKQLEKKLNNEQKNIELVNYYKQFGTCLKPAYEPIIVARKPFKGSLIDNIIENNVGGLNIEECRVGDEVIKGGTMPKMNSQSDGINLYNFGKKNAERIERQDNTGRFPANVILTYDEADFEEVCGGFPSSNKPNGSLTKKYDCNNEIYGDMPPRNEFDSYQDTGSAARYFYCAKASKKDRDEGLDDFEEKKVYGDDMNWGYGNKNGDNFGERIANVKRKNTHPTVKPTELMQYLIRLVTPKGGTVMDCFMGSGSTGKAVMYENKERNAGYKFIGIEMTDEYLPICEARIKHAAKEEFNLFNMGEGEEDV